jgi:Holliday junction resolvase RusA-like endonuclease
MIQPGVPMLCEFAVDGDVRGKGRPRFDPRSGRAYTDQRTLAYEHAIMTAARLAMGGAQPVVGPVRVLATVYVAVPKSYSKRATADCLQGRVYPTGRPDIDNTLKALMDSCNGIVWVDDAQVVEVAVSKLWAPRGRLHVMVDAVHAVTAEKLEVAA